MILYWMFIFLSQRWCIDPMKTSNWKKRSRSELDTEHVTFKGAGTVCDDSWLAGTVLSTLEKLQ